MRNFNTAREIDLNAYLPDILRNIREFKAVTSAENAVICALWEAAENCMNDQFISEATESGLAHREKFLGITPFATDTADDRRFRLAAKYAENVPYTKLSLRTMLSSLCGEDGFSMSIETSKRNVTVKIALTSKKQYGVVKDFLERVLPYNMTFTVQLMYNTWAQLKTFTWTQLKAFTWGEIKEKEALT